MGSKGISNLSAKATVFFYDEETRWATKTLMTKDLRATGRRMASDA